MDSTPDTTTPPKGKLSSLLTTLPIVLTVLATAFAGLSSSEMTQAMFYRSFASQQQSKAGDQWAFFQAKRIRGTSLENTADLLGSLSETAPFNWNEMETALKQILNRAELSDSEKARLEKATGALAKLRSDEAIEANLKYLSSTSLPIADKKSLPDKAVQDAMDEAVKAIGKHQTEEETAARVRTIKPADIDEAARIAEQNADAFSDACEPVSKAVAQLQSTLREVQGAVQPLRNMKAKGENASLAAFEKQVKGFRLAVLEYDARRYRAESAYNRKAAEYFEVRVRRSGIESDRHRSRSQMFFYSMLVAQAGVTIASLALARQQRKSLWLFAAGAGILALGFSSYVYVSF